MSLALLPKALEAPGEEYSALLRVGELLALDHQYRAWAALSAFFDTLGSVRGTPSRQRVEDEAPEDEASQSLPEDLLIEVLEARQIVLNALEESLGDIEEMTLVRALRRRGRDVGDFVQFMRDVTK